MNLEYIKSHPLRTVLIVGLTFRLIAVIFSKGYGWHDDHFLIIEPAQAWVDGKDNDWIPSAEDPNRTPQGHSFFYVGIHFVLLKIMKIIGMTLPQSKMYVIRLLHALWSLLTIYFGFKITYKKSNIQAATIVAIMLSLYWFMPFLSVRNLVEVACIPPLLMATWYIIKGKKLTVQNALLAGIMLGISFSIRFQVAFFIMGLGIALLITKISLKNNLAIVIAFLATITLTQGVIDIFIWNRPFAELQEYIRYNIENASTYGTNIWHMYFSLILGILIPPLSIVVFFGFFKKWKTEPLLFWPAFIFLAFHTYFPNKQERFILPILPFIIILGIIATLELKDKYNLKNKKWVKNIIWFTIILNAIVLPGLTVSYSKRNRVESMCYVAQQSDTKMIMIEDSNREDFLMPPLFYLQKWESVIGVTKQYPPDSALLAYNNTPINLRPNYVVFMQAENITARVDSLRKRFPSLQYQTTIQPSFIDKTMYWLNPVNDNQTTFIYKIK